MQPDQQATNLPLSDDALTVLSSSSPASATPSASYSEHKPKTPPPDLPSLLLDSRIVYIGMPVRLPPASFLTFSTCGLLPRPSIRPSKKKIFNSKPLIVLSSYQR